MLSRRARAFESDQDFKAYVDARRLNRDLLHPEIAETVWLSFMRGDYSEAVFKAIRAVEVAVRVAAGFEAGAHGVPMIRRAFHTKGGPLSDPNQGAAEAQALMDLFTGAIGSYKNPHSHRDVVLEVGEAHEMVILASHLLRIVDHRRPDSDRWSIRRSWIEYPDDVNGPKRTRRSVSMSSRKITPLPLSVSDRVF